MQIKGKVLENPVSLDGCSAYLLKEQDRNILVFASGSQSAKDCIFVSKGQEMEIEGERVLDIDGIVFPYKAKINLKKDGNI